MKLQLLKTYNISEVRPVFVHFSSAIARSVVSEFPTESSVVAVEGVYLWSLLFLSLPFATLRNFPVCQQLSNRTTSVRCF